MVFFIYVWARRFRRGMQLDAALITAAVCHRHRFRARCQHRHAADGDLHHRDAMLVRVVRVAESHWLIGFYAVREAWEHSPKDQSPYFSPAVIIGVFAAAAARLAPDLANTLACPASFSTALVVLPWFIAVQRANPEFFRVFILEHNLARYTTDVYRHKQPFWYYLPVVIIGLIPWVIFAVAAVVDAIRDWRFSVTEPQGKEDLRTYLAIWFLLPIVFFSLSQSKLPGYILPAIPAATILLADFILRREQEGEKPSWPIAIAHAVLCAALMVAALIVPFKLVHLEVTMPALIVAVTLAVIGVLSVVVSLRVQGLRMLRFTTLIPLLIAYALVLRGTAPMIDVLQSARPVQLTLSETAIGEIPKVAVYDVPRGLEYGLGFYGNHKIASYERNEIPEGEHLVVAAAGSQAELEFRLEGRRVTRVGGFSPQHLDFYLVSGAGGPQSNP